MKKSRIALVLMALSALTAVGFTAAGSDAKAKAADKSCSDCSSCCGNCCEKK